MPFTKRKAYSTRGLKKKLQVHYSEIMEPGVIAVKHEVEEGHYFITADCDSTFTFLEDPHHCPNLLEKMYKDDILKDIYLTVQNKTLKAHKAVLRQASGYFKQILSNEAAEECEVQMRDIEFDDLESIVKYIYLGKISIETSHMDEFVKAVKLLDVTSLVFILPDEFNI